MIDLAILGSTRGTHLDALVKAVNEEKLKANIKIVISNKSDALILNRAKSFGLDARFVNSTGLSRETFDQELSYILAQSKVNLIVLIGFMRILSNEFITDWKNKIINVHPSLLPAYAGKMDLDVHRSVLAFGDQESGCTVHYVTEKVDEGPIILQKKCPVYADDTPESLKARVQNLESEVLIEAINSISPGGNGPNHPACVHD